MKPFGSNLLRTIGTTRGCAVAALLLLCAPVARGYSDDKKKTGPSAGASPTPPRLTIPIPVSHDARGIKLPYYDERGKLQMYFIIAKAFRVDMGHLEMKNAYMQTYDEKEAPDANVFMTRSILDLDTRVVTSDVPVTVRRSDFDIVGQQMVFNTQTRVGHMTGHVRMTIYNRQEMAAATPTPGAKPASSPSATPQPTATPP